MVLFRCQLDFLFICYLLYAENVIGQSNIIKHRYSIYNFYALRKYVDLYTKKELSSVDGFHLYVKPKFCSFNSVTEQQKQHFYW